MHIPAPEEFTDIMKQIYEERIKDQELLKRAQAMAGEVNLKPATLIRRIEALEEKVRKLTELVGG